MLSRKTLDRHKFTIAPGGARHHSRVLRLGENDLDAAALAETGGWNVAAAWKNITGDPIAEFTVRWTVPPEPINKKDQVVFLFNGLQDESSSNILQPVLQWGIGDLDDPFGGQYWCIANWYVPGGGEAIVSPWVRVSPGQVLTGSMKCTDQAGGLFSYSSVFEGFPKTLLNISSVPELVWCVIVLESYLINACDMFPAAPSTAFTAVNVRCNNSVPPVDWAIQNIDTSCGQGIVIDANSGAHGKVTIYYSDQV